MTKQTKPKDGNAVIPVEKLPIWELPDNPEDPRPECHPTFGWLTPAVVAWAERQPVYNGGDQWTR